MTSGFGEQELVKWVLQECATIALSAGIDNVLKKINAVRKKRKNKLDSLEIQVYNVIVDVLREMAGNKYNKSEDEIYDYATEIMKVYICDGHENKQEEISVILKSIFANEKKEWYMIFIRVFHKKITRNRELYHEIMLLRNELDELRRFQFEKNAEKKIDEMNEKLDVLIEKKDTLSEQQNIVQTPMFYNQKQEYADEWKSRLFLQTDNGNKTITLGKAFVWPDYRERYSKNFSASEKITLENELERFVEYDGTTNLLITGVPGMGKSSIVSWFANRYQEDDRIIVLRFRTWEKYELKKGLMTTICEKLKCDKTDLNNRVLVLDGFDEMKTLKERHKILSAFFNAMKDLSNFKCVITARPAYVNFEMFHNVIELQPFDPYRICQFYLKITGVKIEENQIINEEVLGIPVILYMAIMSDIDIREDATIPQLYSKIFAEQGGIFDRFAREGKAYSEGAHVFGDIENIRKYLAFLQQIAFRMYIEERLEIEIDENQVPELEFEGELVRVLEFPVRKLSGKIGGKCLEFIHKSIYEYFVSEYMFSIIMDSVGEKLEEKLASVLGDMFGEKELPDEVAEYLAERINMSGIKEIIFMKAFSRMLDAGMMYFCKKEQKNIIEREIRVFKNMLNLIGLCFDKENKFVPSNKENFVMYLKYLKTSDYTYTMSYIDLSNVQIDGMALQGVDLKGVDLSDSEIWGGKISDGWWGDVNLSNTELIGVVFEMHEIENINLTETMFNNCMFFRVSICDSYLNSTEFVSSNIGGMSISSSQIGNISIENSIVKKVKLNNGNKAKATFCNTLFDESSYVILGKELACTEEEVKIVLDEEISSEVFVRKFKKKYITVDEREKRVNELWKTHI